MSKAKILLLDIETMPILAHVWQVWGDQNIGMNQIDRDWAIISWSAKWLGDPASKTMYQDQRNAKNMEDDNKLLDKIWHLLDEADIVITQNGDHFDLKKLNARFIINGYKPPSSFKSIDTKKIAKKKFGFTSNSLEYMSDKLCKKYKKSKHPKFQGFEMWSECLKGNKEAWKEMEHYNKLDVLALEELYLQLQPWDNSYNPNLYTDELTLICACGSEEFHRNGHAYTSVGKYQRFSCKKCGAEVRSKQNLFSAEKKKSIAGKL